MRRADKTTSTPASHSTRYKARSKPSLILLTAASLLAGGVQAQPSFNFTELGFKGPGYETSYGYRRSWAGSLNDAGQVVGSSQRYDGSDNSQGYDAWLYNGTSTGVVGLTGPGYETSSGFRNSYAQWTALLGLYGHSRG